MYKSIMNRKWVRDTPCAKRGTLY